MLGNTIREKLTKVNRYLVICGAVARYAYLPWRVGASPRRRARLDTPLYEKIQQQFKYRRVVRGFAKPSGRAFAGPPSRARPNEANSI